MLSRKENVLTTTLKSRLLIMTSTRPKRELTTFLNWLIPRTMNLEKHTRLLSLPSPNSLEPRTNIQDLWLSHRLSREILMVNLRKRVTCRDRLIMKTVEIESFKVPLSKETQDLETQKNK